MIEINSSGEVEAADVSGGADPIHGEVCPSAEDHPLPRLLRVRLGGDVHMMSALRGKGSILKT